MTGSQVVTLEDAMMDCTIQVSLRKASTVNCTCDTRHVTITSKLSHRAPIIACISRRNCQSTRMPQRYDPLSQDDDSPIRDTELEDSDSLRAGLLPRPAVYYEEGTFDAPSSEDEDESEVVEKNGPGSLNRAEHGNLSESEGELYVGGRKVCNTKCP